MMRILFLGIFLGLSVNLQSQAKRMLCFNLQTNELDTLEPVLFDTTIVRAQSHFHIGSFNQQVANLQTDLPVDNCYSGTQFTFKERVEGNYNVEDFPIRAAVKLFRLLNDTLKHKCSGVLISRYHVLTAAHCVADLNTDAMKYDSLFVSPAFNNGLANSSFKESWVKKVYIYKDWDINKTDFAVLELEEPIGDITGWVSFGFETNVDSLLSGIFYKFSYPGVYIPSLDTNHYNGDTLYFSFGKADYLQSNFIGVKNTSSINGESGSSLIKVQNNLSYTTYGVLTYSHNLCHSLIRNDIYYALNSIVGNAMYPVSPADNTAEQLLIYPNPTFNVCNIQISNFYPIKVINVYDVFGHQLLKIQTVSPINSINISGYPAGIYMISAYDGNRYLNGRLVKMER